MEEICHNTQVFHILKDILWPTFSDNRIWEALQDTFQPYFEAGVSAALVNQDKSKNFFGFVRSCNGLNETPNILEYGKHCQTVQAQWLSSQNKFAK